MYLVPNTPSDQAFWRTAKELHAVLDQLRGDLGASPGARMLLEELEAVQVSLEHDVQQRNRRRATHVVPLQKVAGFP